MTAASLLGQATGQTYQDINILWSDKGLIEGRGVIDSTHAYDGSRTGYEDEIIQGTPLARITTSKLFVPCKRTTVTSGGGATSTSVPVVDARAFKVGDVVTIGSNTGCTITAINYSTNTLTVSSITFANSDVVHATDGSEKCVGFLNEFVKLKDTGEVTPGTLRNRPFAHMVIGGMVDNTLIHGDLAAIRADTGAQIGHIAFADTQGQN